MDLLYAELSALVTVILIDLVLAGDNAVVVGIAAAGLPPDLRRKAIIIGIAAAAGLRIVFATFATQLLGVIGLTLAGGLLLLWVSWKLWREIRSGGHQDQLGADVLEHEIERPTAGMPHGGAAMAATVAGAAVAVAKPKTFRQALTQIIIADVSMSLDNVLAVAGTARDHLWVLVVGLTLSVALMGVAATFVAKLLKRFPWISYLGLALIAYVAVKMIYDGGMEVWHTAEKAGMF